MLAGGFVIVAGVFEFEIEQCNAEADLQQQGWQEYE